ncbi:MAG: SDR family oxidoreductase [Terriglobia bacterium]
MLIRHEVLERVKRLRKWSRTTLQRWVAKTSGRLIKHARDYGLLLPEGHLTRRLLRCIVVVIRIIGLSMFLITGASGRVARRAAALLAQRGYGLRLMTRTPQQAPKLNGAEVVRGDFAELATLDDAFAGVSTALVVSGSGKPGERAGLHRNAFEAGARARVRHIVYLSLQGASPTSKYPFSRDHSLSEQYLTATGVPYTVLRNAFYVDMFLERFDAAGVMRGPANQARGAFVSREDAAQTAAAVLADPPGGTHDVTGPEALSLADVARRFLCHDRPAASLPAGIGRNRTRPIEQTGTGLVARRSICRMV